MNKKEAIESLEQGKVITHTTFTDEEYIYKDDDKKLRDENGYILDEKCFWADRTGTIWDKDWSVRNDVIESEDTSTESFKPYPVRCMTEITINLQGQIKISPKNIKQTDLATKEIIDQLIKELQTRDQAFVSQIHLPTWDREQVEQKQRITIEL